ncbi:MAG: DUF1499 domain-containing protein [Deltaproteobacteria bacterium HGW-Deltaproteobacteria-10]|nr:MAG: DUF1499 domain-containing protein [Deltaproteobacteria bacterium HGW-Deltaproteobacteria-10]
MSALCFAQNTQQAQSPLKTCPKSPNCVSSQSEDSGHAIAPIGYSGNRAGAVARMKKVLDSMKRTKIVAEKDDYLHAEATSLIFRFVDDVEFYFPADELIIHVRSASRTGYSDLGVNRKRVEEIRKRFNEEI